MNRFFSTLTVFAILLVAVGLSIRQSLETPEARTRFAEIGYSVLSGTPEDLGHFVRQQLEVWRGLVEAAGIEKE